MLRFALLKPAGLLVGVVGIASVLGACGSSHPTASSPPSSVANLRRPPASTTTAPHPASKAAPTSTATSSAAPTTEAPATAPPANAPSTAAPPATPAPSTIAPAPSATAAPTSPVRVLADCQTPSYEPATIILTCGDGGIVATAIRWNSWGATSATGTAVIKANLCNPTCAQGSSGSFPASITLTDASAAGTSGTLFSTLTANFPGASPTGTPTETYSIGAIS